MMDCSKFWFHCDHASPPEGFNYIVRIPKEACDKQSLLRVIAMALRFPDYFGSNWDALDECLADLSWLDPGGVVFWHETVPLSEMPDELRRYLDVLRSAQQDVSSRSVVVSFPESEREAIEKCD